MSKESETNRGSKKINPIDGSNLPDTPYEEPSSHMDSGRDMKEFEAYSLLDNQLKGTISSYQNAYQYKNSGKMDESLDTTNKESMLQHLGSLVRPSSRISTARR